MYDAIIDITTLSKNVFLFPLNAIDYQDETWLNISMTYEKTF